MKNGDNKECTMIKLSDAIENEKKDFIFNYGFDNLDASKIHYDPRCIGSGASSHVTSQISYY